jgi:hypothetical protein
LCRGLGTRHWVLGCLLIALRNSHCAIRYLLCAFRFPFFGQITLLLLLLGKYTFAPEERYYGRNNGTRTFTRSVGTVLFEKKIICEKSTNNIGLRSEEGDWTLYFYHNAAPTERVCLLDTRIRCAHKPVEKIPLSEACSEIVCQL